VTFPSDYRRFLLKASDVCAGSFEPATITSPRSHTYLPDVVASAREWGVPPELLPICEDNSDFYCLNSAGEICFWSHDSATDECWPNLAAWIEQVWLRGE
jgi:hypothetical protein